MKTNAKANENHRDIPNAALPQRVAERAYHIWLENGCGHGDHERHWLQAERELMEVTKHQGEPQSDVRTRKKTAKPHQAVSS
jgi:hypothetical protein